MKSDLISLADHPPDILQGVLALAAELKSESRRGTGRRPLVGRTLAMIFEKPSLRTRVTFETGISQLGGGAIYLAPQDIQLGARETVGDIARNLSRWVDLIVARTFRHELLVELAREASVPVINGLTDLLHPCQVLADCQTLEARGGRLAGLKVAVIGDGNNVVNSWLNAAVAFDLDFRLACPAGYEPDARILAAARASGRGRITLVEDPREASRDADALYTDVWTSMGQEAETQARRLAFAGYQLNSQLLAVAAPHAVVMHCLPAHRGEEIAADVLDGPRSVVLEQAENRLHAQKAVMIWLNGTVRAAA